MTLRIKMNVTSRLTLKFFIDNSERAGKFENDLKVNLDFKVKEIWRLTYNR